MAETRFSGYFGFTACSEFPLLVITFSRLAMEFTRLVARQEILCDANSIGEVLLDFVVIKQTNAFVVAVKVNLKELVD